MTRSIPRLVGITLIAALLISSSAFATQYRSRATGTWTANTTWDISTDGGQTWAPAGVGQFPSSTATDTVFVLGAHTITMNGNPGNCRTMTVSGILTWSQNRTTNVGVGGVGDLTFSGGSTAGTGTGVLNVQGSFIIPASQTGTIQGQSITVTGSTSISGTFNISTSVNGNKNFFGAVTIATGGSWNNSINENIFFRNGFTNNGSFSSGTGAYNFSTNSQLIGGDSAIVFAGIASITGAVTVTNNGTVTVTGNLTGTVGGSTWLNATNATLNVGGTVMATGALAATNVPNTVNYTGAAQTVKATTYSKLILSGSGAKTTTGITILDTLSRQGTATISAAPTYSARAVLEYNGSAAQTTGPEFPTPMGATVLVNNTNGVTLDAIKTVNDSIIVETGTFSDGGFQITGDATKQLIVQSGATLQLGSVGTATLYPTNFVSDLQTGSTVVYNSNVAQTVSTTPAYSNLRIQGTSTKSTAASSTLIVNGSMTLAAGTFAPGANSIIELYGDWTNDGGAFTIGSSTVQFLNTSSAQAINGTAVSQTFNAITVDKGSATLSVGGSTTTLVTSALTMSSGTFSIANVTTVTGTATLTSGTIAVGTKTLTLSSTVTGTGTAITSNATGTVAYDQGSDGQAVVAASYGNLTFSNFNKILPASGTVGVAGTFTPGSATGHTIAGSTIDFNGAGSQTVPVFTYHHLTVSSDRGGQTVTFASGNVAAKGDLNLTATTVSYTTTGNTVALSGTASQSVDLFSFNNLTINNAAGITLDGNATVNGTLTLTSGNVTTGASRVIVASTGSISRTSGHIVGTLEMGVATGSPSYTFAIGTTSLYVPATVAFTSVSSSGTLTATTTDGDHPNVATSGLNSALSVNRYWTLTNSGIVFASADVTLNFDSGDIDGGATTSLFDVAAYNGSSWTMQTTGTSTGTSTQATGVTAFGAFQIAEPFTGQTRTWDGGGGNSDWTNGLNWSGDIAPGSGDNAIIDIAATVDISTARSVTTITVNHASAILRLLTGGSLTASGNFILTNGTVETQTTFPSITGSFSMAAGTALFSGSGSQTIPSYNYVNLTSSSTGARVLASSGTIGVSGAFTPGSNSYTVSGSTIEYNGAGSQTVVAFGYNNLASSGSGARTLDASDTIAIGGSFTPGSNSYTVTGSTIDFVSGSPQSIPEFDFVNLLNSGNGNRTLSATGTVRISGIFNVGAGSFTTTGSTVEFNGSGSQTIPALSYHHLTSSGSGARTLASSGTIGIAGTFTPGTNSYTVTGSTIDFSSAGSQTIPAATYDHLSNSGNGDRTLASSGTIRIAGTFTPGSGTYTSTGSTVEFNGSGSQTIPALGYENLTSSNSGSRTLASSGTISISGSFTPGGNSYTITGSTVDFAGPGAQVIPAFSFNDLTISGDRAGATVTLASGIISVGGTFLATATSVSYSASGNTFDFSGAGTQTIPAISYGSITNTGNGPRTLASSGVIGIAGDFSKGSGGYTITGSTINYNGSSSQSVSAFSYANVMVNNSAGVVMAGASSVSGTLTLTSGTISLTTDTLSITSTGSVSRTSGWIAGPLKKYIPTGATSRTFEVGDASVYTPVLVAFASVTGAGDLAVTTTSTEHPNAGTSGISTALSANRYWTLMPTNVTYTTYSVTLNFNASDVDVGADPTSFIVDQYDAAAWQLPTTGTVTSTSTQATGVTGFGDFVVGVDAGSVVTSTATGGNWNVGGTWVGGAVPGNNANVVIATSGGNAVTITASPSNVRMLTINDGSILQGNGAATTLTLNLATGTNFINNGTLIANGVTVSLAANSTWNGTGTYTLGAINLGTRVLTLAFSSPETLSVSAATPITNPGTLNGGSNSYFRFNGSVAQTMSTTSANVHYNNVIIDNAAGVTANATITSTKVMGDIFVNSGTFDNGGFSVTLASGKDFVLEAGTTYRTGGTNSLPTVSGGGTIDVDLASTVVYYGSTQVVRQTTYGTLTIQNVGTKTFESDTTRIAGDFTVTGATIDATTNLSTIEFVGTGAQSIPAMTYYRLLVTGVGPITMAGPIALGSDLEIFSGVFDNNGSAVTMASGRSVYLADNATFRAGGTTSLPAVSGGGVLNLQPLSTAEYYGSAQLVQTATYGHVTFLNAGTKTFDAGTSTILGDMSITSATGDGTANSSTVVYAGTSAQSVGGMDYFALEFTNAGLKTLSTAATAASITTINVGATFRITSAGSLQISADILNDGVFLNEGIVSVP